MEQKRPMNAFLLFCKRQRALVREKYPNLENRSITKILGDLWSKLEKEQKDKYTDLARQQKEAFMKANPDFKWCKTPHQPHQNPHQHPHQDPCTMTSSQQSTTPPPNQLEAPKPPKKRFLERNDSSFRVKDGIVPYISLDQDTLDRVIDEAFSENSNNSPSSSGLNMCPNNNNITKPTDEKSTDSSLCEIGADEPVDFSMNRTINTTSQQIINSLVEKMLSEPDTVSR